MRVNDLTSISCQVNQKNEESLNIWHPDQRSNGQKQDEQRTLAVHYTVSEHYQENVFIEGSRPKFLEDLHTEAQEGLKILQQEENRNAEDFQDVHSGLEYTSSKDKEESVETDSTTGHSITSMSSLSAVSSRPVLTRQGSTFKPLHPVKRLDKTKRRSRRTTIMGIPHQVQRELDYEPESLAKINQTIHKQHETTIEDSQEFSTTEVPRIKILQSLSSQPNLEDKTRAESVKAVNTWREEIQVEYIPSDVQNAEQEQTLGIEVPGGNCISPLPSPQHLAESSYIFIHIENEPKKESEEETILENCWPPPPPPMEVSTDLLFDEQDELDFPPPPPTYIHDPTSLVSKNVHVDPCDDHVKYSLPKASEMESTPDQDSEHYTILPTKQDEPPNSVSDFSMDHSSLENTAVAYTKTQLSDDSVHRGHVPNLSVQGSLHQTSDTHGPIAEPLPESTVAFQKPPSPINKNRQSKEPICRHKSMPVPKEDANIPLVTPSLLQMVRLRSVNIGEELANNENNPSTVPTQNQEHGTVSQMTPQKPIRKSLSLKSKPSTATAPSIRLQEAIRMKTAAMSSSGAPVTVNLCFSSDNRATTPMLSPKSPNNRDLKSPASTASFIFSKSTKKVILETPNSSEIQATLKQSLAAEILHVSDQAKAMITNGTKKPGKVPPPVARKPVHGTNPPSKTEKAELDKTEVLINTEILQVEVNGKS
ncbi:hypothetical protein DNTS_008009 [Danionella cerebrum]|uniref:Uncharacterized protein n=1 Tax=Danionella cerebrum TaxID=2873325 RepID=A0A553NMN3_9TELE|nr:hypothetical protein DNTS_008009 [Danionella translucida]